MVSITVVTEQGSSDNPVLVEQRGRILIITINRPEAKNAVNLAVAQGLAAAMDRLDDDKGLSVGIVTGAGGSFSAGMDLKAFARGEFPVVEGRGLGYTEKPPAKPLIAAVEGYALAGGTELALAADMIVASRESAFGIPEVKRGLAAAAGGLLRLPKILPYQLAMELALTGDPLTAERAHQFGLVNRVTEPGKALDGARELAATIAANGPLAVKATKQVTSMAINYTDKDLIKKQWEYLTPVFASEDAQEGARAFAEKRAPQWKGR